MRDKRQLRTVPNIQLALCISITIRVLREAVKRRKFKSYHTQLSQNSTSTISYISL